MLLERSPQSACFHDLDGTRCKLFRPLLTLGDERFWQVGFAGPCLPEGYGTEPSAFSRSIAATEFILDSRPEAPFPQA